MSIPENFPLPRSVDEIGTRYIEYAEEVARLRKERDELLSLLRDVEWIEDFEHPHEGLYCSYCKRYQKTGHHSHCLLGEVLNDYER